jgi:hypothetical protein
MSIDTRILSCPDHVGGAGIHHVHRCPGS